MLTREFFEVNALEKFLALLQSNEPLIALLFAGIVAICTIIYVGLTLLLVSETSKMRRVHTDPCVDFTIRESAKGFFHACVKNIGNGPAYEVIFHINAIKNCAATENAMEKLLEFHFLKNGIAYLSPGQKMEAYFVNAYDANSKAWDANFSVTINYKARRGRQYDETFIIDLAEQFGGSCINDQDYLKDAHKELKKIAYQIEQLAKGRTSVKIDVISFPEHTASTDELVSSNQQNKQ